MMILFYYEQFNALSVNLDMRIERTSKEIIIRLPASMEIEDLQEFLDFARYRELTKDYKTPQDTVDALASDINRKWYAKNRKRLIK